MTKTALVTGAEGFIGRHLVPKLEAAGYWCHVVDGYYHYGEEQKIRPWLMPRAVYEHDRFDVVVHLAANIRPVDERSKPTTGGFYDITLDLTVADYIERHPPRQCYIYPSSCAVDNPDDPYGWVKICGERFATALHKQGIRTVILRPFSGYGHDQADTYPFPAIGKRAMRQENPLTVWGSGLQIRDFIHVDDLTDAFMLAIEGFPSGEPVEIGTGIGTTMRGLASMFAGAVGYQPEIRGMSDKPESSGVRIASVRRAAEFGFKAKIDLTEGIRRAVESWRQTAPANETSPRTQP